MTFALATLGDIAEVVVGPAFKSKEFTDDPLDTRLLRGANIGVGEVKWGSVKRWPRSRVANYERFLLRRGDVVVAMDRPWIEAGLKVATVEEGDVPALLVQRVACLRAFVASDQSFLRAIVGTPAFREYLKAIAGGVAVPHISAKDIREFKLQMPSQGTRERVGAFVSTLGALLDLNDQRLGILEDVSRMLYARWLDPHRQVAGHSRDQTSFDQVPPGWSVRTIGEIASIVRGRSYRKADLADAGGVPFLTLKCVRPGGGFRRAGVARYLGPFNKDQCVRRGDIVLAVTDITQERRIVAQAFQVPSLDGDFGVPSLDLSVVRPFDGTICAFLYSVFRYSGFASRVREFANGANVLHLSHDAILQQLIAIPPREIVERFNEMFGTVLEQQEVLEAVNLRIRGLRDLLVPRLVTGQLGLSDIDLGSILVPTEPE